MYVDSELTPALVRVSGTHEGRHLLKKIVSKLNGIFLVDLAKSMNEEQNEPSLLTYGPLRMLISDILCTR